MSPTSSSFVAVSTTTGTPRAVSSTRARVGRSLLSGIEIPGTQGGERVGEGRLPLEVVGAVGRVLQHPLDDLCDHRHVLDEEDVDVQMHPGADGRETHGGGCAADASRGASTMIRGVRKNTSSVRSATLYEPVNARPNSGMSLSNGTFRRLDVDVS